MGLLTKEQVAAAKKAQREVKQAKKRKVNTRPVNLIILVICEGEKTEPNYFKSIAKTKYTDVMKVDVEGEGRNTVSLVKKAIEIRNKSIKTYDRVWAVFDKDSFADFNDAINLAKKNKIQSAWSNESFELWYCLHLNYLDNAVSRSQYIDIIEKEIQKRTNNKEYRYMKNDPNMYSLLKGIGNEDQAIKNAKKLEAAFEGDSNFENHNPCTMVYKLVEELNNPEIIFDRL